MAFEQRSLDDYIDVAQRIADFRKMYPEGSLHSPEPWRVVQVESAWCRQCIGRRQIKPKNQDWKTCPRCGGSGVRDQGEPVLDTFIVYVAAAYRTPDDQRPGIGVAWEPYPGQTPYTLGSELQNAETSAWGRAIIAVGASDSKPGIASREEVRNRQAERADGLPTNADGSLSRSRTTDDEKDAAGVMTGAQQAAHTELAKPPANTQPVTRLVPCDDPTCNATLHTHHRVPVEAVVDDPWMDGPAGLTPQDDPEDQPGTALAEQIRAIRALYTGQFGIKDRDKMLDTTRQFLGLDMLSSHTRLSYRQAGDLLLAMRTKLKAAK